MKKQTNSENFDDGLTQVAPKGEFKAMKKQTSLNKDIWKQSKLAGEYPKDYLVIPALDVNDLIRQRVEELKEGFITGRHWDEKDIIYFINKTFGDKLV